MYDASTRALVLERLRAGDSLNSVSRSVGITRATLREWRETETVDAIHALVINPVNFVTSRGCTYVNCITKQWLHVIPQHGAGVKHERPIVLEPWQVDLVDIDPRPLIRGLIHSDGWRGTNWTTKSVGGTTKKYTYPRYQFSNRSGDIRGILTDALDRLGIAWRQSNQWTISVARRQAVEALDEFVGPKT